MSVYILCTSTKCRLCTTLVVSLPLLPHNPPPSPIPISTRPTSSRWVPPYVLICLRFLPDSQGVFSCPCCHCACTKRVQDLGSVKRHETQGRRSHFIVGGDNTWSVFRGEFRGGWAMTKI